MKAILKNYKKTQKVLTGVVHLLYNDVMANKRARDKRILTLWVTLETYEKIATLARKRQCTITDVVTDDIAILVKDVQLTKEQYEKISRQMSSR